MEITSLASSMEVCVPYLAMVLNQLCLAIFVFILHSVLNTPKSINAITVVVYQNLTASALISSLAILFDRGKRTMPSLSILAWACLLGFFQVPVGQLLLAASLRYVTASFQTVGMNLVPVTVFVLAVMMQREKFRFQGIHEQAKLWGVLITAAGAIAMVFASGGSSEGQRISRAGWLIGSVMVGAAVLAEAMGSIVAEFIAMKYSSVLTLTAMASVFGTLQTVIIAVLIERNASSWRITGGLQLAVILYGGIFVTGFFSNIQIWCIKKKGPVFMTSFSPLAIVFSFFLETFVDGRKLHFPSITGALLVPGGLYLLLWGKAKEQRTENGTCNNMNGVLCPDTLLAKDFV